MLVVGKGVKLKAAQPRPRAVTTDPTDITILCSFSPWPLQPVSKTIFFSSSSGGVLYICRYTIQVVFQNKQCAKVCATLYFLHNTKLLGTLKWQVFSFNALCQGFRSLRFKFQTVIMPLLCPSLPPSSYWKNTKPNQTEPKQNKKMLLSSDWPRNGVSTLESGKRFTLLPFIIYIVIPVTK